MRHLLAYGNSDQASFRDPEVRECFDIMTVPSTIASYYPDATAAFVLSSKLDYLIEPRTPLFQGILNDPRASHYSLAQEMGPAVQAKIGAPNANGPNPSVNFSPSFYTAQVCAEVVGQLVRFQREYGQRADNVGKQIARYADLLRKARGDTAESQAVSLRRSPALVLCPYFACESVSDPWWSVVKQIWYQAEMIESPDQICPVVSLGDVFQLSNAIDLVPNSLSDTIFIWVPGFDEKRASVSELLELRRSVVSNFRGRELINLYGGFFSILLSKFGLAGFNNGLGYSESRQWPTLDATGAAPARFYVRRLHAYLPTATATALVEQDPKLRCKCPVCKNGNRRPNELNYHELKRHFALARSWELQLTLKRTVDELCSKLRSDAARIRAALKRLPRSLNVRVEHLERWADVLSAP